MHINWLLMGIFIFVWFAHFLPISEGLEKRFKLKVILSSTFAALLALIPFVNIICAVFGCIYGWRWKWWKAIIYVFIVWAIVFTINIVF